MVANQYELIHLPHIKNQKNSIDIEMTVNIMNAVVTYDNIQTVIILSSDYDFRGLIQTIKMRGKRTILLCDPKRTNTKLLEAADEYFDYYNLTESDNGDIPSFNKDLVFDKLVEAIKITATEEKSNNVQHYSVLTRLKAIYPELFNYSDQLIKDLKLSKNWFSSLMKQASEENLIDYEIEGSTYLLSLINPDEETKTETLKQKYFDKIIEIIKQNKNKIQMSKLSSLITNSIDINYKDIGYKSFKVSLQDASDRGITLSRSIKNPNNWNVVYKK